MTKDEKYTQLSKLLVRAYWMQQAANLYLQTAKEYKNLIQDKELLDSLNQVSAKGNFFTKKVKQALLSENIHSKVFDQEEELIHQILDQADQIMDNLVVTKSKYIIKPL
jgi:hypothetical protein